MRQLIALPSLLLLACTSGTPVSTTTTSEGGSILRPFAAPAPAANFRTDRQRMNAPARNVKRADPRVTDCASKFGADRQSLDACLEGLTHPQKVAPGQFGATLPPIVNPSWQIEQWFFSSSGLDTNTCVDSSHPCKTIGAVVWQRWQTDAPRLRNLVQFNWLNGQPSTADRASIRPVLEDGAILAFVGTPSAACTTTLSSVTAKNRTTVPNWQANIAACASGAQYRKVVDTTHPAVFWVSAMSGSVATFTQPFASNVPSPPTQPTGFGLAENDVLANGDSVTFYDLPTLYVDQIAEVHSGQFIPPQVFVENMRIGDPLTGSGTNSVCNFTTGVLFSESRVDCQASLTGQINSPNLINSIFVSDSNGPNLVLGNAIGGQLGTSTLLTGVNLSGALVDGDALLLGDILVSMSPFQDTQFGIVNLQTALDNSGQIDLLCNSSYGSGGIYGTPTMHMLPNSFLNYETCGSPSAAFLSSTALTMQTVGGSQQAFARAFDPTRTPAPWIPSVPLSVANLGTSVAAGGFDNIAYGDQGQIITGRDQASAAPAQYIAPVGNGGTGLDAGCPDGSTYEGTGPGTPAQCVYVTGLPPTGAAGGDLAGTFPNPSVVGIETKALPALPGSDQFLHYTGSTWSFSPLVTGVSSVTGAGTVNCSPTSGAVTCTGTAAVSSVTGTSGVSCSPTSGAVSCSVSSVTTGQITHGTPNQVMTTNSAGNASQWSTVSTDLAPLGNGSFETVGLLSLPLSVSGAQLQAGNVLTYTGAQAGCSNTGGNCFFAFQKPQPPGSSNSSFGGNSLTIGPTNTVLASTTLNAPSGAGVLIVANFNFRNNLDFLTRGGSGEDVIYGIGDSGTGGNFYSGASATLSVPPDSTGDVIGGFAGHQTGHAASPMVWRTTGTGGTVTYQALANAVFYSGMTGQGWIFALQVP